MLFNIKIFVCILNSYFTDQDAYTKIVEPTHLNSAWQMMADLLDRNFTVFGIVSSKYFIAVYVYAFISFKHLQIIIAYNN